MSIMIALALASATAELSDQYRREWQSCITDTARLWATKSSTSDRIVDAAILYCHVRFERYLLVETDKVKAMGLNSAQADEYNAFSAASLLRIIRGFAVEAVDKARAK